MITEQVSPLQLSPLRKLPSGMTESSHLSQAYLTEADKMEAVMAYAFGTTNDNVLSLLTGGMQNTRYVNNREYTWTLHAHTRRIVEVTSDPITTSETPGIGGSAFTFVVKDDIFRVTDNIVSDNQTQARIKDVNFNGIDYLITAVLTSPDRSKWLSPSQIKPGAKWSKDYSTVEEGSLRGGGTDFQAPMELTNQLTTLRKEYDVTRSAATDVMVIELYSPDGSQSTRMWTLLAEWTCMEQWYNEIDTMMLYSEYNKDAEGRVTLKGDNNRPVYHGAGVRQQISPANRRSYIKLTFDLLYNFLLDLSYNADRWGGNHKFVALTGKMGMKEFDDCIQERKNSLGITVSDSGTFIKGNGDDLTLTGYFKNVEFLNGMSLSVKEFAPYDDITRCRILDPVSKKPINSYNFTILNIGYNSQKGFSNVRKVAKKDSEHIRWYEAGSIDQFGVVSTGKGRMGSNGFDGYKVHMMAEIGVQIQDPTSCGELYKAVPAMYA